MTTFIQKDDQDYQYFLESIIQKEINGVSINTEATSPTSGKKKVNISMENELSYFKVFQDTLNNLCENKEYKLRFVTINDSDLYPYSNIPLSFSLNNSYRIIKKIIIANIIYCGHDYYLIDAGPGTYIGVFRNFNLPFEERNDNLLTSFIRFMIGKHFFNWAKVYHNPLNINRLKKERHNQILKDHNIQILKPIVHLNIKETKDIVINLTDRIKSRLNSDQ